MNQLPNVETHIPVRGEIPAESTELAVGRPDLPTPSLWQQSVKVRHKLTKESAVVVRVDWGMNMFRAYYTERGEMVDGKRAGVFSERTEWEHCKDWDVEVTYSPKELERQAAKTKLEEEIAKLDAKELAAVMILVDDPDPAKALGKLEALRVMGVIKAAPEVAHAAAVEAKKGK